MIYIKQLDSIRAIAAFLVIIWHWIPQDSFINQFPNGFFGVNLFFVLSGFLITSILLTNRNESERLGQLKKPILKNFYVRRFLRIFPIYYLTILLMVLLRNELNLKLTMYELIACITYTSNFYVYLIKSWPDATLHFWSLAVEEQFYLLWPLLMLYIPQRYLLYCILLFILIGVVSQSFISDMEYGYALPQTCFDCLGTGALLAWVVIYKPSFLAIFYKASSILALLGVIVIVLNLSGIIQLNQDRFAHALIGIWLITHVFIYRQKKSLLVSLLNSKLLIHIGKISYGIYLLHILYSIIVFGAWEAYVTPVFKNIAPLFHSLLFLFVNFGVLCFICTLSWKYFEKPILQLKNKFNYQATYSS